MWWKRRRSLREMESKVSSRKVCSGCIVNKQVRRIARIELAKDGEIEGLDN